MKPDQKGIYCLAGRDNLSALKASPKIEPFTSKGYEVLLMTDPVDEVILQEANFILPEESKDLLNIAKDDVTPYSEDEKKANEEKLKEIDSEFEPLRKKALEIFGDKLETVRPSLTLTSSPACLKDAPGGMSLQWENLMRSAGQTPPVQKRILELSANNPVVKKLISLSKDNSDKVSDILRVLYDQSLILEGVMPDDPAGFVKRVDELMAVALKDG